MKRMNIRCCGWLLLSLIIGLLPLSLIANDEAIQALLKKGINAHLDEHYKEAIDLFNQLLQMDSENQDALYWRAFSYSQLDDYQKALQDLDTCLWLNRKNAYLGKHAMFKNLKIPLNGSPGNLKILNDSYETYFALIYCMRSSVHWKHGNICSEKGDFDGAIDSYQKSIDDCEKNLLFKGKENHNKPDLLTLELSYEYLGDARAAKGDYEKAMLDYFELIRLNPEESAKYAPLAWFLATCPEKAFRDGKKAVEYATKGIKLSTFDNPSLIRALAAGYAEIGNFDRAIEWQTKYLNIPSVIKYDKADVEGKKILELYKSHQPYRKK